MLHQQFSVCSHLPARYVCSSLQEHTTRDLEIYEGAGCVALSGKCFLKLTALTACENYIHMFG